MLKRDEMIYAGEKALSATKMLSTDEMLTEIWDFMNAVLVSPNGKQAQYFQELAGYGSADPNVNVTLYEADQINLGLALINNIFKKWDV